MKVESSPPKCELPRTVADRLERDHVGVIDSRHSDWRRGRKMIGREEWVLVRD